MARFERRALLKKFRDMAAKGEPIVGGGAGTGLSAKCEEAGGVDLIVIYNSGRYRMAGRGSLAGMLPYGDANAIVLDMAREVLPVVEDTPVLAGVCGTDPFRQMPVFLAELVRRRFAGRPPFPAAEPEDVSHVIDRTPGIAGFFGASSIERLPTEVAITETVRRFKALPVRSAGVA